MPDPQSAEVSDSIVFDDALKNRLLRSVALALRLRESLPMADDSTAIRGARVLDAGLRIAVRPRQEPMRSLLLDSPAESGHLRHRLGLGDKQSRRDRTWPRGLGTSKSPAMAVRRANVEGPPNRTNGLDTQMIPRRTS